MSSSMCHSNVWAGAAALIYALLPSRVILPAFLPMATAHSESFAVPDFPSLLLDPGFSDSSTLFPASSSTVFDLCYAFLPCCLQPYTSMTPALAQDHSQGGMGREGAEKS